MPLGSRLPLPREFPSMLTPLLSHCLHILSVFDLWNFDQNNSWCKINPDRKKFDLLNVFIFPWLCKVSWSCFLKRFKTKLFSLLSLEYHWHKHWPFHVVWGSIPLLFSSFFHGDCIFKQSVCEFKDYLDWSVLTMLTVAHDHSTVSNFGNSIRILKHYFSQSVKFLQ